MRLVQTTTPGEYPVTVADAKRQCAIFDDITFDNLLQDYIKSVTKEVEAYTKSVFMSRTMVLYMDKFPAGDIQIPVYPVQSVTSILYDDSADTEQTLASSNYWVSTYGMQPFIRTVNTWPTTYLDKPNTVRVTFTAGYASADVIPEDIKQTILLRVYEMFENRGTDAPLNKHLAMPHRRFNV